jgi:DNA-binding transcriptional LysR family regulator
MELRHLRYFVAVAEELHFGRAAQRLLVSQPPLSQQIHDLEHDVGTLLLLRTRRRVELTDAGRVFLKEVKDILSRVDAAVEITKHTGQGHSGRLTVAYTAYAALDVLPDALEAFCRRFPQVEVVPERMTSIDLARALRERRIDIGLSYPPFPKTSLEVEVILREQLVVVLPQDHPSAKYQEVPLKSLAGETFVFTNRFRDSGYMAQVALICRSAGFELRSVREAHDDNAILPTIAAGLGVCLAPVCARKVQYTGVVYRDLENCPGQIELAVVWRKQNESSVVNNFLNEIRERLVSRNSVDSNNNKKKRGPHQTRAPG